MLTIKAEGSAGMDLKKEMLPDMLALAYRTQCAVEVKANDTKFIVYPHNTITELEAAYDRLYPKSTLVMVSMKFPLERPKTNV